METKANYILIGLFTIAGLAGLLGFFLWFARIELDRQFAYYDIRFSSVSGLGNASDVRFSGLPVGQVVDVRLAPDGDGTIIVRIEVGAETPVREDSVATIESQGVTGVSFVGIAPGSADAPLLTTTGEDIPEIPAGRSTLQSLTEDAPELLAETLLIVQEIGDLFRGENEGRLERILLNVETASAEFAATLEGFSGVTVTVNQFALQIDRFNTTLDALTAELATVLASADETLGSADVLIEQATTVVGNGATTLDTVRDAFGEAERFIEEDLAATATGAQEALAAIRTDLAALREDATALINTLGTTGTTATERLRQVEGPLTDLSELIATLETAASAVGATANRIDGLLEEQGEPLLAETRLAIAAANDLLAEINLTAEEDLPAVMADIRAAAETLRTTVEAVGTDLTGASGQLSELTANAGTTLTQVTETFANANETLAAINAALETGEGTLTAATNAFTGADTLINEDLAAMVVDLRGALEGLNTAVGTVSEDIPEISADIRAASAAAAEAFTRLQTIIDTGAPGVQTFISSGLPLYTRLAEETRSLIANLENLTQRISRNPAQFFLEGDLPEFRR